MSQEPIIRVQNIGKSYRVGATPRGGYRTLRESLIEAATYPLRQLKTGAALGRTDEFWALQEISFDVKPGEVVGIIGRNGAGKSTLLKILSGITAPTTGRVELRGRVGSLLEVGTGFHPELTGRENVFLNGSILGMRRREIQAKFDEIVDFSGVEQFLDTPVKRYSSGMKVRLAFSVAAFLEPEILVIDEVLAVGDAAFQQKCLGTMGNVAKSGRTVLFVSHNMAAIESLCTRGVLLDAGSAIADTSVAEALSLYTSRIRRLDIPAVFSPESHTGGSERVLAWGGVVDSTNAVINQAHLCQDCTIGIGLDPQRPLIHPSIGIGIDDMLGRRILTLHTPTTDNRLDYVSAPTTVRCRISQLPLAPGTYIAKLALSERSALVDSIDDAFLFDVIDTNSPGDGRGFSKGLCAAKASWDISPHNSRHILFDHAS